MRIGGFGRVPGLTLLDPLMEELVDESMTLRKELPALGKTVEGIVAEFHGLAEGIGLCSSSVKSSRSRLGSMSAFLLCSVVAVFLFCADRLGNLSSERAPIDCTSGFGAVYRAFLVDGCSG